MITKCREEGQETLLKFKYGAKATLFTTSVGGLSGALGVSAEVGAGIGGLAGGPLGLAIGAGTGVVGAGIGALAFGTAGAVMGHSGPHLVDEVMKKDYQKRVEEDEKNQTKIISTDRLHAHYIHYQDGRGEGGGVNDFENNLSMMIMIYYTCDQSDPLKSVL